MKECMPEGKRLNEDDLHYNFVFFFAGEDYWKSILGKELYDCPNVHVYQGTFEGSRFLKKLFKLHWAYRINCKLNLPFKTIWFHRMYRQSFPKKLPLCFVYMGANCIRFDGGFCKYVRKQDPKNRQVILHNDLISKKISYDYDSVRSKVDIVTTYDKNEAEKYGICYFQETTYSKLIPEPESTTYDCDAYFLGAAKDRLSKILDTCRVLTNAGLKCKFLIAGVAPEQQVQMEGVTYIRGISYEENLLNVIRCRCVVELIQEDSCDITTRALEAIAYRRRLLTDCQICDPDFFNPGQLQVFTTPESIRTEFVEKPFSPKEFEPKLDMNPLRRLFFIQEQLEAQNRE